MSEDQIKQIAVILSPNTIFRFHQLLINRKYHILFFSNKNRKKPGPKGPSREIIDAILEMKKRNPRMGCPKMALTISKIFGIEIDKDIVRRILKKYYHPSPFDHGGPSWLTFLGHTKDSLWSLDLFRAESIYLKTHWVMLVMDQYTRRIIGLSTISSNALTGGNICTMFNKIIGQHIPPKYMSSDNDPLFLYFQWKANMRIYEIKEIKSIPYTPISHPFIERVIGTTRREYLDNILFFNTTDLENKLNEFKNYYNEYRFHQSLQEVPCQMANKTSNKVVSLKNYHWRHHAQGLFQTPCST